MIEPPIFIAEGLDLSVLPSVVAAEQHVESPDVDNYEVLDSTGRKLRFLGKTAATGRFIKTVEIGPVQLVAEENEPTHQTALRDLIIRCLNAIHEPTDHLGTASLEELVELAMGNSPRPREASGSSSGEDTADAGRPSELLGTGARGVTSYER